MAAARKKHLDEFSQFQTRLESLGKEVALETEEGQEALREWCQGVVNWLTCLTKREIDRTVRDRRLARKERQFFEESILSGVNRLVEDAAKASVVMLPAEAGTEAGNGSATPRGDGKVTSMVADPPVSARR